MISQSLKVAAHLAASLFIGLSLPMTPANAAPLLVEGKQTVYQRVLTRPGAGLTEGPDSAVLEELTPFEPFYVFSREGEWIEVGRIASADPEGWLPAEQTVEWRQNIVAAFTNPANRSRQLIFADLDSLRRHMNEEQIESVHQELLEQADAGTAAEGSGVISVEPAEYVDIQDRFYIMPILGFVQEFHPLSYEDTILMNVASLPLEEAAPPVEPERPFDVGIVFVIDTTKSMQSYFEVMRVQVQDLVTRMAGSEISARVNFGIVAFRDDDSADARIGYRVREILPLERRESQDDVLAALSNLEEAEVSTPGFNEDSLSAVSYALEEMNWNADGVPFGGRFIVLVTDAGPKLPSDQARNQAGTGYENAPEDLQAAAEALKTAILVVHLRTPNGEGGNHEFAEAQYRVLSHFGERDYYFPIEGGAEQVLAAETQRLVTFFRDQVAQADGLAPDLTPDETGESLTELGRAIRLQYLGSQLGTSAPDVFDGWVSSLSENDGQRQAISMSLLVTRNQLATMADLVEEFIRIGENLRDDEGIAAFHSNIREAIVRMAQDPTRLIDPNAEGMGDAMEFLEDLPYQSVLLRTSLDRWIENPGERQVVIDGLTSKLRSYRRWLSSSEVWVPLFDGAPDSEWVTAMPVEFLP